MAEARASARRNSQGYDRSPRARSARRESADRGFAGWSVGSSDRGLPDTSARRTITITGRGNDRLAEVQRRSARRRATSRSGLERAAARPDRVALWAVLLGVMLVLVAATSSHAAISARLGHGTTAARTHHAATLNHAAPRPAAPRALR